MLLGSDQKLVCTNDFHFLRIKGLDKVIDIFDRGAISKEMDTDEAGLVSRRVDQFLYPG